MDRPPSARMPPGWKVGDPLPDEHPWRAAALRRFATQAATYRKRAKLLERNRLDMRLRPETRQHINDFIRDLGWTATEVVEHAITEAHRRIYGGALSSDDLLALDAGGDAEPEP